MATIFVIITVIMGVPVGTGVFSSRIECERSLTMQRSLQIMDLSAARCVEYRRRQGTASDAIMPATAKGDHLRGG